MTDPPRRNRPFAHRLQGRPSLTAEMVCLVRAAHHRKPARRRVIEDPYAELFLSRANRLALSAMSRGIAGRLRLQRASATYVPLRHRFLDDALLAALDQGAEQVVVLGAGYDTRAWRFARELGDRSLFEVDLPAISRAKQEIVERHASELPETRRVRVEIDFETQALEDALPAAGFEPSRPTCFVWEGVSMYLTRSAVKATLDAVWTLGGPGTRLGFDMWHLVDDPGPGGLASRALPTSLGLLGEPVTFGIHPEELGAFLERRGFAIEDLALIGDLRERYSPEDRAPNDESMYLVLAKRLPERPDAPST